MLTRSLLLMTFNLFILDSSLLLLATSNDARLCLISLLLLFIGFEFTNGHQIIALCNFQQEVGRIEKLD